MASDWAVIILHTPVRTLVSCRFDLVFRLRFGRVAGADGDVALDDPKLSRHHATITRVGVIVEIRDHDSLPHPSGNGSPSKRWP